MRTSVLFWFGFSCRLPAARRRGERVLLAARGPHLCVILVRGWPGGPQLLEVSNRARLRPGTAAARLPHSLCKSSPDTAEVLVCCRPVPAPGSHRQTWPHGHALVAGAETPRQRRVPPGAWLPATLPACQWLPGRAGARAPPEQGHLVIPGARCRLRAASPAGRAGEEGPPPSAGLPAAPNAALAPRCHPAGDQEPWQGRPTKAQVRGARGRGSSTPRVTPALLRGRSPVGSACAGSSACDRREGAAVRGHPDRALQRGLPQTGRTRTRWEGSAERPRARAPPARALAPGSPGRVLLPQLGDGRFLCTVRRLLGRPAGPPWSCSPLVSPPISVGALSHYGRRAPWACPPRGPRAQERAGQLDAPLPAGDRPMAAKNQTAVWPQLCRSQWHDLRWARRCWELSPATCRVGTRGLCTASSRAGACGRPGCGKEASVPSVLCSAALAGAFAPGAPTCRWGRGDREGAPDGEAVSPRVSLAGEVNTCPHLSPGLVEETDPVVARELRAVRGPRGWHGQQALLLDNLVCPVDFAGLAGGRGCTG